MSIASEIFRQLGGNKFVAMTGARNIFDIGDGLRFRIGKNASKTNIVTITLNGLDLYDMKFECFKSGRVNSKTGEWIRESVKTVAEFKNVYNDQLQDLFTRVTGMYTHL